MVKTEMTNDRNIATLKAIRLVALPVFVALYALAVALGGFGVFAKMSIGYATIAASVLIIAVGLTFAMMERTLKKRMGDDAYRAWKKTPRVRMIHLASAIVTIAVMATGISR
ncbi:MAG: hypothetical protein ACR2P4_07680 [Gammaproteobacteria bacterium]